MFQNSVLNTSHHYEYVTPLCLAPNHLFHYPNSMEIHFAPETEKKLQDLAAQSGRKTAAELVQDVIEGYFEELTQTRTMLDSRYDDLKSGRVKSIPGEEVEAYFRDKSAAARRSQSGS
jgi:predicted DNA-binding protein